MRIAISGAHRTGKSTLAAELGSQLSSYTVVAEPYDSMAEDGYEFVHPPTLDDFIAQLERSLADVEQQAGDDVIFDRGPLDILAYIQCLEEDSFDLEEWLPKITDALETLDFVVLVPVEVPDRIAFSSADDDGGLREAVDEKLQDLLLDDPLEFGVNVLQVQGDLAARTSKVLARIAK